MFTSEGCVSTHCAILGWGWPMGLWWENQLQETSVPSHVMAFPQAQHLAHFAEACSKPGQLEKAPWLPLGATSALIRAVQNSSHPPCSQSGYTGCYG